MKNVNPRIMAYVALLMTKWEKGVFTENEVLRLLHKLTEDRLNELGWPPVTREVR